MFVTEKQIANFKAKLVLDESGCLLWQGSKIGIGHGQIRIGSQKNGTRKLALVHRLAYFLEHGVLPDDLLVRHTCDTPACCLPAHLVLGTHQDNMDDMVIRLRSSGNGQDNRGTGNPAAKLTWEKVREIRELPRTIPNTVLGEKYGVTHSMISAIRLNKAWIEMPV
jgi:hypothetical protein